MSGHLRLAEPREEPGFQGSAAPGSQRERWDNGNGSGWGCRRVHSPGWGQFQRDRKCQAPLAVAEASPQFGGCLQLEGQQIPGMRSHFPWPWSCSRAQPSHPSPPELVWEREIFYLFLATRVAVEALPLPAARGRIPLDALSQRCCCIPSSQPAFSSR